jgi:hypothetical protein
MSSETIDTDSIGPKLSLDEVAIPQAIGERMARLYGVDDRPRTAADWMTITLAELGSQGHEPTVADLCTSPDGAHTFTGAGESGESQSYVCVLDPLAYPFLVDEPGTVRSETPVRETAVTFEVGRDSVDVAPESAVVSLGVSDHVDAVETVTFETVYRQVCGYIHAFEDEAEYEAWATDVEAATTPLPAREGVALAREIALTLFDAES